MTIISRTPVYNLKAVLKETGLTADVLRAWERRYGLPVPQRTTGGHRLYSQYNIETVKWLRARQMEGLSISRAVELWKGLMEAGRDPLDEYSSKQANHATDFLPASDTRIEILRGAFLEASLAFDEIKVEDTINQAFAVYPIETVCTGILQAGLREIGEMWYRGEASVQQEHFASALAIRRIEALIAATPHPTLEQSVLVGAPPGEMHTFPILLLSLLLRRRSLEVVYLGANVPLARLEETVEAIQPALVVLAAQQLTSAARLLPVASTLQENKVALAYGGLIFNRLPKLRERMPAHFLGETLEEGVHSIERLVVTPIPYPTLLPVDEDYQQLANLYRQKRPLIEVSLYEQLQAYNLPTRYFDEANFYFGNGLSAALELGEVAFLEVDLEWIQSLLTSREIPSERLLPFLGAYGQEIRKVMGDTAAPVTAWIDALLDQDTAAR